jgi:hypothetical protein
MAVGVERIPQVDQPNQVDVVLSRNSRSRQDNNHIYCCQRLTYKVSNDPKHYCPTHCYITIQNQRIVIHDWRSLEVIYFRAEIFYCSRSRISIVLPLRISWSSSSFLAKFSPGRRTARSIATGKPLCLPLIITAHRISLLTTCQAPLKL